MEQREGGALWATMVVLLCMFLVGVRLDACVHVTHVIPSNVMQVMDSSELMCLCLSQCIYLGEEVEAAQAADDAVDLREPPAFTTGL